MQEKLAITVLVITLALFALVYVLYTIVRDRQADYTQTILGQQDYDSRVIPYRRGDIVDRNGTYLATSDKVYNLIIDCTQIMAKPEDTLEPTIAALVSAFGYDGAELRRLITENPESPYIRYERQLTNDQKENFETIKSEANSQYSKEGSKSRVKGVWFEDEYKRTYPYGSTASTVLGFAQKDGSTGTGGIEQYYNEDLIGNNGREYGYLNDDSNLERVIKPAANGNTVVSTLDLNIQNVVEKYIDQWQAGTGSQQAAVIVMDPDNGEVLAMAATNRYDLNNPRDLSAYYTEEEIASMDTEAQMEAWNKMWRNFCVSDTYEPGSTQKVFTVAAALEEGLSNGFEYHDCGGFKEVGGWRIRCVARNGHGPLTVEEGIMKSCNIVMMDLAAQMGRDRFSHYQELFGFGSRTGIDLPGEADTKNLVYSVDRMGPTELATNSFGQNYNCTMVQMAAAYCSIVNGGSYYEPHVVKQIVNEQGAVVRKIEPKLVRETVSKSTSDYLKNAMFKTVDSGTGSAAAVTGYQVGGKTGTAEKLPRSAKNYVVSFAGYAPVENPEVMVYVVIDTPNLPGTEQAHSSFASTIFSQIVGEILPYMNVFPTTDIPEEIDENLASQEEGINVAEPTEESTEETQEPEETTVSYTDEFIVGGDGEDGDGYGSPGLMSGPDGQEVTPEMSTEDLESSAADDISSGESTPASEAAAESSAR